MPKKFTRIEPTTIQEVGDRFRQQVVVKRFRTEDGLEHEFTTFVKENFHSVAVLALTPSNEVVVSRQFRAGREYYCDDLPGGGAEEGEELEAAARRELFEETGYTPDSMEYLGKFSWFANTNLTSHYFLATDCKQVSEPQQERAETDQGMAVHLISIEELIEAAKNDKVTDAVAVLMAYDRLKKVGH